MSSPSSWRLEDIALGVFVAFFFGSMARGQAIYWLARVSTDRALAFGEPEEGWRRRVYRWLHSDRVAHAHAALAKWGWPLVPFAYLTVGFQSMVMAAAGMVRMSWKVFTLAQVPGAVAWALIYTTVGFAFWGAFFAAVRGNPVWVVLLFAVATVAVLLARRRRPRLSAPPA